MTILRQRKIYRKLRTKKQPGAGKLEFQGFIEICLWVLGKKGKRALTLGAAIQVLISLLDVIFLALIAPFVLSLAASVESDSKILILGKYYFSPSLILVVILCVTTIKAILSLSLQKSILRILANREAEIASAFIQRSLFEKIDRTKSSHSADLLQIVTNVINTIFTNVFRPAVGFFGDVTSFIAILLALTIYNPAISIMTCIYFSLLGIFIFRFIGRLQQDIGGKTLEYDRAFLRAFSELKLIAVHLRLSNGEAPVMRNLFEKKFNFARNRAQSFLLIATPRFILEFFLISGLCLTFFIHKALDNQNSMLPTLALLAAAGYRILPSINSAVTYFSNCKNSRSALMKIDEIGQRFFIRDQQLVYVHDLQKPSNSIFKGDLVFENVFFNYIDSSKNILDNFSMRIPEDSVVLVEGVNGSGKTTLILLALGMLDPRSGHVYIEKDGVKSKIMEGVSGIRFVSQAVHLLDESLGHNIAVRPFLSDDLPRLLDVSSRVGILDLVRSNDDGFASHIGENGTKLSAGERQKIGIARALFDSPDLLILDEPTANLDPESEEEVWSALKKLRGEMTIVIVSHRKVPEDLYDIRINLNHANFQPIFGPFKEENGEKPKNIR